MKPGRSIVLCLLLVLFAAPGWSAGECGPPVKPEPIRVTILFFNDLHGYLQPFTINTPAGKREVGGIARLAALTKTIRFQNSQAGIRTLLLMSGDILQGTPMSTVFRGRPDMECFNAMGVDAMTVGNHDFDFGMENFLFLKKMAAFPFLSANVVWKGTGEPLCRSRVSFKLAENTFLTVIGVTTSQLLITTKAENVASLKVLDPVQSVKASFGGATEKGPVVLLSHCRHRTDRAIAAALPELAAIVGGHDHVLLSPYPKVGNVPVFQAFEKGRYLGRIDLEFDPTAKATRIASWSYIPVTAEIDQEPIVQKIVDRYHAMLDGKFGELIGNSKVFLSAERKKIRYQETNMGNFVTDIMRNHTGARIALLNSGSLRASIGRGPVTLEDVFKSMPFANEIVLVDLTGEELLQALTRSVAGKQEDEDGGFLQVSGIRFTVRNHAVENVRVGKDLSPLDPKTTYRVAITDFLATGGDGYAVFSGKRAESTGLPLRELMVDAFRSRHEVDAQIEGRIYRRENAE